MLSIFKRLLFSIFINIFGSLAASPCGWTNSGIAVEWIKVFNAETLP